MEIDEEEESNEQSSEKVYIHSVNNPLVEIKQQ